MLKRIISSAFLTIVFVCCGFSQNITQIGILPKISLTSPITNRLTYNLTSFTEINTQEKSIGDQTFPSQVLNLTFINNLSFKLDQKNILAGGYLFRVIDPFEGTARVEHRFIQQLIHINHINKLRIRLIARLEERFIESKIDNDFSNVNRLSFLFGADIPLQGQRLDNNEFYFNTVTGFFFQTTTPRTAFHNLTELYFALGFKTKKLGRVEIGPEFKVNVINDNSDKRTLLFLEFIWYKNLNLFSKNRQLN